MRYFSLRFTPEAESIDASIESRLRAERKFSETRAIFERAGEDPDLYVPRLRDEAAVASRREQELEGMRRRADAAEVPLREALTGVRQQAVSDALGAWSGGELFFAPLLFQPRWRDGERWERALHEIAEIGWRLQSWQVVGPAPEPFGPRVTLIQTLFVR